MVLAPQPPFWGGAIRPHVPIATQTLSLLMSKNHATRIVGVAV